MDLNADSPACLSRAFRISFQHGAVSQTGRARWPLRRAACIDSLVFLGLIRVERRKDWTATL